MANEQTAAAPAQAAANTESSARKPRFTKKNEITALMLSLLLGFTVMFFSPMEVYLSNQREFSVGSEHVLIPMLLLAVAASAGVFLLLNLCLLIRETFFHVVRNLLFGCFLAMYVQMMFLNGKMRSFTGDPMSYGADTALCVRNFLIHYVIIMIPIVLYAVRAKKPESSLLNTGKGLVIAFFSGAFLLMQLAGFGTGIAQNGLRKMPQSEYSSYFSYTPTLSVSKENNVIVFLMDRLDSLWMDDVLEQYPELNEELSGFTFYQNNVSVYPFTLPSVAQMLTGVPFRNEDETEYLTQAWRSDPMPGILRDNGWAVNLLISHNDFHEYRDVAPYCDNLRDSSDGEVQTAIRHDRIVGTLSKISVTKVLPYILKELVTTQFSTQFIDNFIETETENISYFPGHIAATTDLRLNQNLTEIGLNADSEKPTFTFFHLVGAHNSSANVAALWPEAGSDPKDWDTKGTPATTRGCFVILHNYIEQLKALGQFENTTIIIIGDHGRPIREIEVKKKDAYDSAVTTALLIKPRGTDASAALQYDTAAELSNKYFPASILEYAGIDHSIYGVSFSDVIDGGLQIPRYQQTNEQGSIAMTPNSFYYEITGNARDFSNWTKVPDMPRDYVQP